MEGSCSTGQSLQWAVVPVEEEEFTSTIGVSELKHFDRRHPVVFLILNIKWLYSVETLQKHTIISTLVCLHVSVNM
jgi:hypothetical protein